MADAVELEPHGGGDDERLLAALIAVRDELDSASEIARLLRLGSALDAVRTVESPAQKLAAVGEQPLLADFVAKLREADALVSHGLGAVAIAALLVAPPREIRIAGGVAQAGLFTRRGTDDRCAIVCRWRVEKSGGYREVTLDAYDEVALDGGQLERLLENLAYDGAIGVANARVRVAIVIGPSRINGLDVDDAQRRLCAVGAVHDVAVDLIPILNARDLRPLDTALADVGYDLLVLWVNDEGDPGWAWRRGQAFNEDGGQLVGLYADDLLGAATDLHRLLDQMFGSGEEEEDNGGEIPAVLGRADQEAVRTSAAERAIKVVFVGGNERQEQYRVSIEAELAARYGAVEIVWFGGWDKNWNETLRSAENELADEQVLVLMPYTGTLLGRGLRRAAESWIPCTGRGRQAMQQAIERALVEAVRRRRVGRLAR